MDLERVNLDDPEPDVLDRAARRLLDGDIVAAPSDTVYGLLALPRSRAAREALERLKGRAGPFLVLVSTWEEARSFTLGVSEETWKRLRWVWPGPVTVILPAGDTTPGAVNGGIALRMPRSEFLTRLMATVGEPLYSTSANRPGERPPTRALEVVHSLGEEVPLILDGGGSESGQPSTLVDMTGEAPRVIRSGRGDPAPLLDPTRPPP